MAQVFLVDRNDSIRQAMRLAFEAGGHRVTEAAQTDVALAQLRLATRPGIVLIDYTDLWSAGASFVQAIAADPILASRHVYLLTTTDRPTPVIIIDHTTGLPLPVLLKPFDTDALLTLVGQAATSIHLYRQSGPPGIASDKRVWGAGMADFTWERANEALECHPTSSVCNDPRFVCQTM